MKKKIKKIFFVKISPNFDLPTAESPHKISLISATVLILKISNFFSIFFSKKTLKWLISIIQFFNWRVIAPNQLPEKLFAIFFWKRKKINESENWRMSMREDDPDSEVMQGNQPTSGETKFWVFPIFTTRFCTFCTFLYCLYFFVHFRVFVHSFTFRWFVHYEISRTFCTCCTLRTCCTFSYMLYICTLLYIFTARFFTRTDGNLKKVFFERIWGPDPAVPNSQPPPPIRPVFSVQEYWLPTKPKTSKKVDQD